MMLCNEVEEEIRERQSAELEFVRSAYSPEEAWVVNDSSKGRENEVRVERMGVNKVHVYRRLKLTSFGEVGSNTNTVPEITVDLVLTMPGQYPVDESSPLEIQASLLSSVGRSASPAGRKTAIDAIPDLLKACRLVALKHVGQEALFVVLSRADEWVDNEWQKFIHNYTADSTRKSTGTCPCSREDPTSKGKAKDEVIHVPREIILAQKLIYSHHIIAKAKRKAIAELSRAYQLGGFAKIGWPGIIIVEGEEDNCNKFIDEIKSMRWQHIVVRGEELVPVGSNNLNQLRAFPLRMEELGEDQMSDLAARCRDAGLEDLFKTSMKMYNKVDDDNTCHEKDNARESQDVKIYGTLVHVDHMNDKKSYEKWIQKACRSAGCYCILKRCFKNDNSLLRPIIFVCLLGEKSNVRQIMKRWRTSRVDVDSKGNPCLERMMSVLVEGGEVINDRGVQAIIESANDSNLGQNEVTSMDDMKDCFRAIGGTIWENAVLTSIM